MNDRPSLHDDALRGVGRFMPKPAPPSEPAAPVLDPFGAYAAAHWEQVANDDEPAEVRENADVWPPQKERAPQRCPLDRARVERHARLIHDAAKHIDGYIVVGVGRCDPNSDERSFRSYRARVGDIGKTVEQVMDQDGVPNANVWIGLFVVRPDAPRKSRGDAETCAAVLGLVADLDRDKGDRSASAFPFDDPTYVVRTSPANEQPALIFDEPMAYADAKRLAERLSAHVGGDGATGDPVHVWRVDGTANWPDRKKIERGRAGNRTRSGSFVRTSSDASRRRR